MGYLSMVAAVMLYYIVKSYKEKKDINILSITAFICMRPQVKI